MGTHVDNRPVTLVSLCPLSLLKIGLGDRGGITAYLFSGDGLPQVPPGNEVLRGSTRRQEQVGGVPVRVWKGPKFKSSKEEWQDFCATERSMPPAARTSPCLSPSSTVSARSRSPALEYRPPDPGTWQSVRGAQEQTRLQKPRAIRCHIYSGGCCATQSQLRCLLCFFVFSLKPELPTQKQALRQRKAGPGISSQRTSLEHVGPGRPLRASEGCRRECSQRTFQGLGAPRSRPGSEAQLIDPAPCPHAHPWPGVGSEAEWG